MLAHLFRCGLAQVAPLSFGQDLQHHLRNAAWPVLCTAADTEHHQPGTDPGGGGGGEAGGPWAGHRAGDHQDAAEGVFVGVRRAFGQQVADVRGSEGAVHALSVRRIGLRAIAGWARQPYR